MKRPLYKLKVPEEVAILIRSMHPHLKKKVKSSLKMILSEPESGKELKDELVGSRSFRVSRFRIIYRISGKQIEIVAIGPRERIYEETYRIFRILGKKKRISFINAGSSGMKDIAERQREKTDDYMLAETNYAEKGTVLFMRKWMYKIDKKEIIRRHNESLKPTESSLCLKFKAL